MRQRNAEECCQKMNLLFVTTHLPPDYRFGGVVQSGQALLTSFRELLSGTRGCCVSPNPARIVAENPIGPVCARTRLLHRWGFSPRFSRKLRPLISQADIVAINGIVTFPMTVAGRMCQSIGKPYVVSVRGGLLPYRIAMKALRKRIFFALFVRPILQGAAVIHVTSEDERDSVIAQGVNTPIAIVPNGVTLPPDDWGMPEELPAEICSLLPGRRLVLFLSRIDPVKGLDLLLITWANIVHAEDHTDAILVIAGPDERGYTSKLKVQAQELDIEDEVLFFGMVHGARKWALYRRADVFILPSYAENFGLVVAEALACGTPVITTTGTPWEELIAWNAGRWVTPEPEALGAALRELLDAPGGTLQAMGLRGRELVKKHYSWDTAARKMITVYRNILERQEIPLYPKSAEV